MIGSISSAMTEFKSGSVSSPQSTYIWPAYNQPKIEPVRKLTRDDVSEPTFYKANKEKADSIRDAIDHSAASYQSNGRIKPQTPLGYKPGDLFSAMA